MLADVTASQGEYPHCWNC